MENYCNVQIESWFYTKSYTIARTPKQQHKNPNLPNIKIYILFNNIVLQFFLITSVPSVKGLAGNVRQQKG